jgi:hypothetical protein
MGADLLDGDVELTEFEEIDVQSIKGVPQGANGFPVLMMKGLSASDTDAGATADTKRPFPDGTSGPEQPAHMDLTGTHLHLAHGGPDANGDGLHQHAHEHHGDGDHDHAHDAHDDAGGGTGKSVMAIAAAGGLTGAELQAAVEEAVKAKQGAAERETDDDAGKSVAEGGTGVQTDAQGTDGLAKAVEDAVTKANEPLLKDIADLKAANRVLAEGLAKVKATPLPGGPVLSNVRAQPRAADGDDWAAKAALYRSKAEKATTPADREGYRQLAREADDKAAKAQAPATV